MGSNAIAFLKDRRIESKCCFCKTTEAKSNLSKMRHKLTLPVFSRLFCERHRSNKELEARTQQFPGKGGLLAAMDESLGVSPSCLEKISPFIPTEPIS
ncbi:uncharacterized protein LOC143434265 isoform X2 [Arvicanthis niloticus]|uniref:uncharacterized protein LOC143308616 isoform X2 n=1 Tax=Arvicanthis niloticus TaxID=61156 RepID=UPI00402B1A70